MDAATPETPKHRKPKKKKSKEKQLFGFRCFCSFLMRGSRPPSYEKNLICMVIRRVNLISTILTVVFLVLFNQVVDMESVKIPGRLEDVGDESSGRSNVTVTTFVMQDGIQLPGLTIAPAHKNEASGRPNLILLHGLGAKNPKLKDHTTDEWTRLVAHAAFPHVASVTFFASRGHRGTTGWESTAESDIEQFTWDRLSRDMLQVGDAVTKTGKVVMGGSSMGSATSLYAALHHPERVAGLVLVRPPTAWEERKARRMHLLSSAKKCQEMNDHDEKYHFVLRGTANSDFPPIGDVAFSSVLCPVLILAVENDDSHPLSTATQLHASLVNSELVVSANLQAASQEWPDRIARFIERIQVEG